MGAETGLDLERVALVAVLALAGGQRPSRAGGSVRS
jgi:hypothetical protein